MVINKYLATHGKFTGPPIVRPPFPYYSHKNPLMGMVWEAYGKGWKLGFSEEIPKQLSDNLRIHCMEYEKVAATWWSWSFKILLPVRQFSQSGGGVLSLRTYKTKWALKTFSRGPKFCLELWKPAVGPPQKKVFNRNLLFQGSLIFGCHVSFRGKQKGCVCLLDSIPFYQRKKFKSKNCVSEYDGLAKQKHWKCFIQTWKPMDSVD